MTAVSEVRALHDLARLAGVVPEYEASDHAIRVVEPEALMAVLRARGIAVDTMADVGRARRERFTDTPVVAPVLVAEADRPALLQVNWDGAHDDISIVMTTEAGDERALAIPATATRGAITVSVPATRAGFHRLDVRTRLRHDTVTVISAPSRIPDAPTKTWGVFVPTYALGDPTTRTGTITDLVEFGTWVADNGGSCLATLPMLASYDDDDPFDPSPYSPISRTAWNPVYLDLTRVPELAGVDTRGAAHRGPRADLQAQARVVADLLGVAVAAMTPGRANALASFVRDHPYVEHYARFRAAVEQYGRDRSHWPAAWITEIPLDGVSEAAVQRYRYEQFVADEQMAAAAATLRSAGTELLLDLPVGTRRDGFDTWESPQSFAAGASVGAPPDSFFTAGQNWGFPPPDPHGIRSDGYTSLRRTLAFHLEHASMLRIDHVMGMQRLWWIPEGSDAIDGAYVSYHPDELFAVVRVLAAKHGATVVGENLGTVSDEVNEELDQSGVLGIWVAQFQIDEGVFTPPTASDVATLSTHDTATFAAFWRDLDDDDRTTLLAALGDPSPTADAVLDASLTAMGTSDAAVVLVALEDLLLALEPQNVPGTGVQRSDNWTRRVGSTLGALAADPALLRRFSLLTAARSGVA